MVSRLAGVSVSSLTMDNTQYADNATAGVAVDPYSEAYTAETQTTAPPAGDSQPRMRSRSRSPAARDDDRGGRRSSPAPKRPTHAPIVSFSPLSLYLR
jgi:hypothetical protein